MKRSYSTMASEMTRPLGEAPPRTLKVMRALGEALGREDASSDAVHAVVSAVRAGERWSILVTPASSPATATHVVIVLDRADLTCCQWDGDAVPLFASGLLYAAPDAEDALDDDDAPAPAAPAQLGPFQGAFLLRQEEDNASRFVVRVECARVPAFWLQLDLVMN